MKEKTGVLASDCQCDWSKCRERAQQALAAAICALLLLTGCVAASSDSERPELMVFAAVSLGDALGELATSFERVAGIRPVLNLAGSNVLGQQLLASPVADVFLSADPRWVDRLEEDDLIAPGSRRAFLSNRLVVVAHPDSKIRLTRVSDLATADFRFLSLGDPAGVPAGRYAKAHYHGSGAVLVCMVSPGIVLELVLTATHISLSMKIQGNKSE